MKTNLLIALVVLLSLCGVHAQEMEIEDVFNEIPIWRQGLAGYVIGRPAAQVDSVVVATDGGNLRSYSRQGTFLWDFFARGRITPYVSRSREGTCYICRTNGLLIAVNRAGRELWRVNLRTPLVFPVLTGWDGRIFVFTDKKITCMTAAGYMLWSRTLENRTLLAPVRDASGGIVLIQEDGELLSFDAFGNAYSYTAASVPVAAASLDIENMGPTAILLHEDRGMELVYTSLKYGETFRGKLALPSPPIAAAGRKGEAAILLRDGRVALVSAKEGKILWVSASHIRAGDLPAKPGHQDIEIFYDERGIYVITKTGATGFLSDGRRLWYMRLMGAAAIPSFGDDGILYSGGVDWILNAYRLEDRVRGKQQLIYGEAPEGSYGTGTPRPSSWASFYFRFSETVMDNNLKEIRQAIKDGAIGANEKEYTAWLMEIAGSLLANPWPGNHPPVHSRYRIEATRLLAFMGSQETIPFLADLFNRDPEPLVKAAAADAIGKIGVDPEGFALRAFEAAIVPPAPLSDEIVLTSIAGAAGALSRFSGPPLSSAGIRILILLMRDELPPGIRNRAERELKSLRG